MSVLTGVRSSDGRRIHSAKVYQSIVDEGVNDDEAIMFIWKRLPERKSERITCSMYWLIGKMTHCVIIPPLLIWRSRRNSFEWISRIFLSNECTSCVVKTETMRGEKNRQDYLYRWKSKHTPHCSDSLNTSTRRCPFFCSLFFSYKHLYTSLDRETMPKHNFMISKAVDLVARKLAGMDSETIGRLTQVLSEEAQMISEELQHSGQNVNSDILAARLEGLVTRMKYEFRNQVCANARSNQHFSTISSRLGSRSITSWISYFQCFSQPNSPIPESNQSSLRQTLQRSLLDVYQAESRGRCNLPEEWAFKTHNTVCTKATSHSQFDFAQQLPPRSTSTTIKSTVRFSTGT